MESSNTRINTQAVAPARWIKQGLFAQITGYGVEAQRTKMNRGIWPEGSVWRTAPDGNRLMSLDGYYAWVEGK